MAWGMLSSTPITEIFEVLFLMETNRALLSLPPLRPPPYILCKCTYPQCRLPCELLPAVLALVQLFGGVPDFMLSEVPRIIRSVVALVAKESLFLVY